MRADRHAAGGDENVRIEAALERCPVRGRIVRGGLVWGNLGAGGTKHGRQHHTVRLVDLAVAERLAGRAELRARRDDGDAGSRSAERPRNACGCERRDARRRECRARPDDGVACSNVAAEGPNVRARLGRGRHLHGAVAFRDELDRDHGVRSLGDDPAGCDSHCLTGEERPRSRLARGDVRDDGERSRRVRSPESEPVHRRARKARQVDDGTGILREHAPCSLLERDGLTRERRRAREDLREGVLDGDGLGHGADGTHGVRSGA